MAWCPPSVTTSTRCRLAALVTVPSVPASVRSTSAANCSLAAVGLGTADLCAQLRAIASARRFALHSPTVTSSPSEARRRMAWAHDLWAGTQRSSPHATSRLRSPSRHATITDQTPASVLDAAVARALPASAVASSDLQSVTARGVQTLHWMASMSPCASAAAAVRTVGGSRASSYAKREPSSPTTTIAAVATANSGHFSHQRQTRR
jgi:hypothetical protein